jgi:hypothetical protein
MLKHLQAVRPLIDIQNSHFQTGYDLGFKEGLREDHDGPLPDRYLSENVKRLHRWFDGKHEGSLYSSIGFYLGMIHGSVLTAGGQLRPHVTTLVVIHSQEVAHGYKAGREWFFYDATRPEECWQSDCTIVEQLRELVKELPHTQILDLPNAGTQTQEQVWEYGIGCVLGELSGHLFPQTTQERLAWEEDCKKWAALEA